MTSLLGLSGCRVVEGIFKAGWWVGVITVVGILAIIVGGAAMVMRSRT